MTSVETDPTVKITSIKILTGKGPFTLTAIILRSKYGEILYSKEY